MYFVRVLGISQVTNEVLLFQYTKVTQTKAKVRNSLEKKGKKWGKKECTILEKRKKERKK